MSDVQHVLLVCIHDIRIYIHCIFKLQLIYYIYYVYIYICLGIYTWYNIIYDRIYYKFHCTIVPGLGVDVRPSDVDGPASSFRLIDRLRWDPEIDV